MDAPQTSSSSVDQSTGVTQTSLGWLTPKRKRSASSLPASTPTDDLFPAELAQAEAQAEAQQAQKDAAAAATKAEQAAARAAAVQTARAEKAEAAEKAEQASTTISAPATTSMKAVVPRKKTAKTPKDPNTTTSAKISRAERARLRVLAAIAKAQALFQADLAELVRRPGNFAGPDDAVYLEVMAQLQTVREVSLDLETTSLTKWSTPDGVPTSSKVGTGETVTQYSRRMGRLAHVARAAGLAVTDLSDLATQSPGKLPQIDDEAWLGYAKAPPEEAAPEPRARILSLGLLTPGHRNPLKVAFDLDLFLSDTNKPKLTALIDALDGKVWVGHNLSFDMGWLRQYSPTVKPAVLLDTFLLTLTVAPHFEAVLVDRLLSAGETYAVNDDGEVVYFEVDRRHQTTPQYMRGDAQTSRWDAQFTEHLRTGDTGREAVRETVRKIMLQRQAAQFRADEGEASRGLPLALLSAALLGEPLDKAYQKPHNWMVKTLSEGHYDYCLGDITQPPKIARLLLGLPETAPLTEVFAALGLDEAGRSAAGASALPGATAFRNAAQATDILVRMQHKGLHFGRAEAKEYIKKYREDASNSWQEVVELAPALDEFRDDYLTRMGQSARYKETLVAAYQTLAKDVVHPVTETGAPALGAKEVLAAYKNTPAEALNTALSKVSGSVKRANMAQAYLDLTRTCEHGRLHSIVSIATMTMRTASQDPNLQNAPNAKDFRALFTGQSGKKLVAGDFSAVEMRVAAALAERSWFQFRGVIALAQAVRGASLRDFAGAVFAYEKQVSALYGYYFLDLLGTPASPQARAVQVLGASSQRSLIEHILDVVEQQPAELPDDWPDGGELAVVARPEFGSSTPDSWGVYYQQLLARILRKLWRRGALRRTPAEDNLTLSDVFRRNVDVHLATALSLAPGDVDTRGMAPVDYLASLPAAQAEELKSRLKKPRQSAKACLAEGTLVLTPAGWVPIERIQPHHLVWDGVEWVPHQGVIFKGHRSVMTYDGLTATPDHEVFVADGRKMPFEDASRQGLTLARTSRNGHPVWWLPRKGSGSSVRQPGVSAPLVEDVPVYDLVNAGPRHRFTAAGRLVSNCNFGLLYGMQAPKLHKYGIVTYKLDWSLEEAEHAREVWFDLYPELELWHLLTRMRKDKVAVGDVVRLESGEVTLGVRGNRLSKLFRAETLSGRPVCATQMPAVLNYQDQGSAAEIAFETLIELDTRGLAVDLVAFVHDEFVLEVEAERAEAVRAEVHEVLCDVGSRALEAFGGIRVDAEVLAGDYWIH